MPTFWRRIVVNPDAFLPEVWKHFLQFSLTALGAKHRPVCGPLTRGNATVATEA